MSRVARLIHSKLDLTLIGAVVGGIAWLMH